MSVAVDREKILQTAQKHVEKRRYDKAVDELRKVVEADPQDVRTLLRIGDLHLKLEQYQDAIETYEQVGNYYYREGFSVKAIAVYKQIRGIIRRHAQHLEGRYGHIVPRLAEIYTQLGLTSDALAAYDEVATRLRREGRERDALDIFKKVVDLDPQNPIAHLRVADSRARLGDMDQAVERFGEAAEIMVGLGRTGDALKVLERLLEYRQAPVYARRAAELYLNRGQQNDGMAALKKLQVAFKSNPKDMETLKMLARAFEAIGQPKKAIDVLKESARIARDAGDHAALNELLDLLTARAPDDTLIGRLDQWRLKEAARLDEAELEVETEDLDVEELSEVFELEEDELDYGEDPAGQTLLGEGQVEVTQESAVRNLIGEAERQRLAGRLDQAIRLLRDGLRNLRGAPALRHRLSDILLEAGDQVGAISEKLVLARELAHENDIGGAVQMLDEVLLLQPDQPEAMQMRASLGHPVAGSAY
ncbi:MAG: tetratricopeptide repeat protein, partial [Myxococcota bacterium]